MIYTFITFILVLFINHLAFSQNLLNQDFNSTILEQIERWDHLQNKSNERVSLEDKILYFVEIQEFDTVNNKFQFLIRTSLGENEPLKKLINKIEFKILIKESIYLIYISGDSLHLNIDAIKFEEIEGDIEELVKNKVIHPKYIYYGGSSYCLLYNDGKYIHKLVWANHNNYFEALDYFRMGTIKEKEVQSINRSQK